MNILQWLMQQLFGAKTSPLDGRAPQGDWIEGSPDPEISSEELDLEYKRDHVYPLMTLHELLPEFNNNLSLALEAKGVSPDAKEEDQVTKITDAMMKGELTNEEFPLLARLKNLKRLILRGTKMTDEALAALAEMPQLEDLLLENSWGNYRLSDEALKHLSHLPQLREFKLDGGTASGVGLQHVSDPTTVKSLGFDKTPITNEGLAVISRFTNLERLRLWRKVQINDEGIKQLQKCRCLKELDLGLCGSQEITNETIRHLVELPQLKAISVGYTAIDDDCVDDLLRMPELEAVSFSDDQITLESLRKLEAANIEVEHGELKEFEREENVLRYMGVDFGIDQEKSSLQVHIQPDDEQAYWSLDIQCLNELIPSHMQPADLSGPPMPFGKPWRELEGQTFHITYGDQNLHPIMPDNPCNIYVGWHACPDEHVIKMTKREGKWFSIDWTCVAKESAGEEGEDVWVNGDIPLTKAVVWSKQALSLEEAKQLAARYFDLQELGEPEVDENDRDIRYVFPVIV